MLIFETIGNAGQGMRLRPWIMLSSLGIGTYLGEESNEEDERVIAGIIEAVARGCNVVDTARNYRHGTYGNYRCFSLSLKCPAVR